MSIFYFVVLICILHPALIKTIGCVTDVKHQTAVSDAKRSRLVHVQFLVVYRRFISTENQITKKTKAKTVTYLIVDTKKSSRGHDDNSSKNISLNMLEGI